MVKRTRLLLLAVWVLAGELWLQAEARAAPYGVKLCGREFIRAVIFICGGSRWRRADALTQEAMGFRVLSGKWGEQITPPYGVDIEKNKGSNPQKHLKQCLAHGGAFPDADADADSLAGKLDETVASNEWLALTKSPQAFYGGRSSWQGTPGALRGGRDVLTGLSSNCCKWGCSKSEISSLC